MTCCRLDPRSRYVRRSGDRLGQAPGNPAAKRFIFRPARRHRSPPPCASRRGFFSEQLLSGAAGKTRRPCASSTSGAVVQKLESKPNRKLNAVLPPPLPWPAPALNPWPKGIGMTRVQLTGISTAGGAARWSRTGLLRPGHGARPAQDQARKSKLAASAQHYAGQSRRAGGAGHRFSP